MTERRQAAPRRNAPSPVAGAAALDKAFVLVDRIAEANAPPTAAELQQATGLPRSTLFRLLTALEARGYVRRDPRERGWRLGFRLFELAQRAWSEFDLHDAALHEIGTLPAQTGETVQLVTLDGGDCVIVAGADGTRAIRLASALGQRSPWSASAGGIALVAFAEADVRNLLLSYQPDARREALAAELELVRGRGYAIGTNGDDDVADLAVPILDVRGHAAAALALAGPSYRLDDRRLHALAPVLMAAARRISHNAGGTMWSLTPVARAGAPARGVRVVDDAGALLGEAPYWSPRERALYWVDMLRPALHRFGGEPRRLRRLVSAAVPCQRGGFVLVHPSGLFRVDGDGRETLLAHPEQGHPDQRYNDAKCDPEGRIVVGTLDTAGRPGRGRLWRVDAGGRAVQLDAGFTTANGLAWSPDGRTLYFADSGTRTIYAYDYDARGEARGRRAFVTLESGVKPDGLATDIDGGVWVAVWDGWRVERYAPDGRRTRTLRLPVPRPTSVAFGGSDLATLFVTSARARLDPESLDAAPQSGALFAVDVGVRGTPVAVFAG